MPITICSAPPISQSAAHQDWTRLLTNQFDINGNFNFTNAIDPNAAHKFLSAANHRDISAVAIKLAAPVFSGMMFCPNDEQ